MEAIELSIEPRANAGKGAARAARRNGKIPAILYGAARTATLVAVDAEPRAEARTATRVRWA